MDHLSWKTLERRKVLDCRIFEVHEVDRVNAEGDEGTFVQIQAPDWVTIVPVMRDKLGTLCFVMVRQYRHGNGELTVEFPAGTVETDETPEHAALRELLEETGCRPSRMTLIGEVSPNPAFLTNRVTYFAAEGLETVQSQDLDDHEMIDIELIPVKEVIHAMGTGAYSNGIMVAAMAFYERWQGLVHDIEE